MLVDNVSFAYGDKPIFKDFSLELPEGRITAVLGDSGVGKTTLLHLLAGLVRPDAGRVEPREVSYMFQEPRLLPTLDVLHNLTAIPGINSATAVHWLEAVGLGDSLHLMPHQLSGGMAQRVSMARAFAHQGGLLLMDEPFKGLDVSLQARLYQVFSSLWREGGTLAVLVTHDPDEAVTLASRVVVLRSSPAEVVYCADVGPHNAVEVREGVREALMR